MTDTFILLYYVCEMYKSKSYISPTGPIRTANTKIGIGFVHSTDIVEQNQRVCCDSDVLGNVWLDGIKNLLIKRHLDQYIASKGGRIKDFSIGMPACPALLRSLKIFRLVHTRVRTHGNEKFDALIPTCTYLIFLPMIKY